MTTDLPAVPEEAIEALCEAASWPQEHDGTYSWGYLEEARGNLAAALPHLYAAALRHAADQVKANYPTAVFLPDSTSRDSDGARMTRAVCAQLRRMADEAVQE